MHIRPNAVDRSPRFAYVYYRRRTSTLTASFLWNGKSAMSSSLIRFVSITTFFVLATLGPGVVHAQTLPPSFQESVVFSGLTNPMAIQFASDGRIFVAEKSGLIKVFDSLTDPTPDIFADLRTNVFNFWDRGILGLALHPNFPATPYVYVLYTYDAAIGGTAPRWGIPGATSDNCPTPPGPTANGCVVSGRLSRLQASGNVMVGTEQVLIEGWCQQYPSHSLGSLAFGADGALYVSAGEGANFDYVDYGQSGDPLNPCGDPPAGTGGTQTPPTAEGGALRSQSLRRPAGEPVLLNGAILRVDPSTGAALPDNPLSGSTDLNARRIVAFGLRNPFRIATRPGTNEVWVGDVGWGDWEEINRVENPTASVKNFGWPCYEGGDRQPGFEAAGLNLCTSLYATPSGATPPLFTYNHAAKVVAGEPCPTGGSSISGLAFYNGGNYPSSYSGALFFADYSRNCIWVMFNPTYSGVVSAYGFEEGTGTTTADMSGYGNTGALSGATWTTAGKYGNGLIFNGTNARVSVPDAASLHLTTAMTLEAWVKPSVATGVWRDVIYKGNDNYYLEGTSNPSGVPASGGTFAGSPLYGASALAVNTWSHLATTYDGTTLRLYVNGVQVASRAQTGAITVSTNPLEIGGDLLNGQYFNGTIDEVRLYNRALSASEIQTDMNTAVGSTPAPQQGNTISTFVSGAAGPVDLKIGPGGDLFYSDLNGGTIRRIRNTVGNQPPTAAIVATPSSGSPPLTVNFSGSGSSDPDPGDTLTYSWDLNGDGVFGDSVAVTATYTYTTQGPHTVRLTVTDSHGASNTATTVITVGTPPVATIDTPLASLTWKVGDVINFSGHAIDAEDGVLPATQLSWSLIMHHCSTNCHTHPVQDFLGVASGSFTAPDHEYPSYLELRLTVTDSTGLTDSTSVLLDPQTVVLSFQSNPTGLQLVVGGASATTPFDTTVIVGSSNSVSAPSPQASATTTYWFGAWSDGGAQSHNVLSGVLPVTYTAAYIAAGSPGLVAAYGFEEGTGTTAADLSGNGNTGTLNGATWTTAGKYGKGLVFNGTSALVSAPDATSLHLTTAMTLEAWVKPSAVTTGWRDVIYKGNDNYYLEGTSDHSGVPGSGGTFAGSPLYGTSALAVTTWSHLATTYDGATLRLYVNGAQVASRAQTGAIAVSTNPLEIGGDLLNGQYFNGTIDEARVYNRALTAVEVQADGNTSVGLPAPDLGIAKTHATSFTQGQTGATYTLTVSNVGTGPTSGTVTVTDTLPAGLTASAIAGTGWACTLTPALGCTRSDALAARANYPAITLTVNVAANASSSVTNTASVSGGGDATPANNQASDLTAVFAATADLAATMSGPTSVATNSTESLALGVTNNGPTAASNVQLATATPLKTTFASITAPTGWSCTSPAVGATGSVTCATATLAAGGSGSFTLVVNVNACAGNGGTISGSATVSSTTSDPSPANNTASANTTIVDNGACDDGNACTNGDACVSGTCVGSPVGPPPEVSNVAFSTKTTASWNAVSGSGPSPTYDVARGVLGQWPAGTGPSEACVQSSLSGTQTDITDVPAADSGTWYLIRAHTSCGAGTYGTASGGTTRGIVVCP